MMWPLPSNRLTEVGYLDESYGDVSTSATDKVRAFRVWQVYESMRSNLLEGPPMAGFLQLCGLECRLLVLK